MRKYRNQILLGLAIALACYIALLLVLDLFVEDSGSLTEDVFAHLGTYPWLMVIPLALTQTAVGFFRFLEWHYYMGVIDARDKISLLDSAIILVAGFTMVVSPGKVAEVLKAVALKAKTGVPVARSAPVVIAERVVDGIAVIILIMLALLIAGDAMHVEPYRALIIVPAALLVIGLVAIQIAPLAYFLLSFVKQLPFIQRIHEPLVDFYESSREIFKLKHVIPTTLMGIGVYLGSSLSFLLVLLGFGLVLTPTLALQAMFITGVSAAVGALSGVPNGAGVTEFSNTGMILALIAPQNPAMTPAAAATAAIIDGFFHKWFRVVVGMAVILIFRQRLLTPSVEQALEELEMERARKSLSVGVEHSRV